MTLKLRRSALAPWTGVFLGALAWFAHHQIASGANYWDCTIHRMWLTAGTGVVFGLVAAAGGAVSWRARTISPANPDRPGSRSFAGAVGAMAAAIFVFAIFLQSLSGLIVPGCFR